MGARGNPSQGRARRIHKEIENGLEVNSVHCDDDCCGGTRCVDSK